MRILIDHISKSFGAFRALNNVSLQIEPGSIVAMLGPNGAGKTTLLRCLAGIIAPDQGRILYDNQAFSRARIDLRQRLCFLPDFPFTFAHMTVVTHVAMCLQLYGRPTIGQEEQVVDILRDLDLLPLADLQIGHLSRGQAYKVALAGLYATNPDLWLLDEPFASGMDPHGISVFKQRARLASEGGHTVMYSTQILEIAKSFCDAVCVIHHGQLYAYSRAELEQGRSDFLEEMFRQLSEEH